MDLKSLAHQTHAIRTSVRHRSVIDTEKKSVGRSKFMSLYIQSSCLGAMPQTRTNVSYVISSNSTTC